MKLITSREFIRRQIADFSRPYRGGISDPRWLKMMQSQRESFLRLDPEVATYEEIDAIRSIFGCTAWRLTCNECGKAVDGVVRIGAEEPDYDSSCEDVCLTCLEAAHALCAQGAAQNVNTVASVATPGVSVAPDATSRWGA